MPAFERYVMLDDRDPLFQQAVVSYRQGQHDQAENLCQQLLDNHPQDADGLNLLGLIAQVRGQHEMAMGYFSKASQAQPGNAGFYNNIAGSYFSLKQFSAAKSSFEKALQCDSENSEALFNLACLHQQQSRLAIPYLERLLAINPGDADAVNQFIGHLLAIDERKKALAVAEKSVACIPDDAGFYFNLGVLRSAENVAGAIEAYKKAIQYRSEFINAHTHLAHLYLQQNDAVQAVFYFQRVTAWQPETKEGWENLCAAYLQAGKADDALKAIRNALKRAPKDENCQRFLSQCLAKKPDFPVDNALIDDYLSCLESENNHLKHLLRIGENILWHSLQAILKQQPAKNKDLPATPKVFIGSDCWGQLNAPVIIRTLQTLPLRSLRMEQLLTSLRRAIIETAAQQPLFWDQLPCPFLSALAEQCFYNEYIYQQTLHEKAIVEGIRKDVESRMQSGQEIDTPTLVLLACYEPLYALTHPQRLLENTQGSGTAEVQRLLIQQVKEPITEENIKPSIRSLTPIEDETSIKVQRQYEESPYPRWSKPSNTPPTGLQRFLVQEFPDLPPLPSKGETPTILVAGCGTGNEIINIARKFPDTKIIAIDLSLSSLAYAIRKADELNVKNITWRHADILKLEDWQCCFDVIISAGVLHHLQDPMKGWRVLTRLLKPSGFMYIGLYSQVARQSIEAARQFIRERGYPATSVGIRQCRHDLMQLPEGHPAKACTHYDDFFTTSNCRDLLFHVQEQCYTFPMIEEALQSLGLDFLSLHIDANTQHRFCEKYGQSALKGTGSLALWHQYETERPETFLGMYQFWLHKPVR